MLRACCWVGMHVYGGDLGLCCVLVGCFARLFVGLRAYCSAVLHVYWGKGVMCILLVT